MASLADIKSILYTEKTLGLQEKGVLVIQTSPKVTKNQIKEIMKSSFGFTPLSINSLRQSGKSKRIRSLKKVTGGYGTRASFKKFYIKLPEDVKLDQIAAVQ